jgi:hypothetical protein
MAKKFVKLNNLQTQIPKDPENKEAGFFSHSELLNFAMNSGIKNGIKVSEMKKRADLRNALKNANENIEISEDDLNYLIDLFENTTWPLEHEDIVSLYDLLQNSL